MVSRSRTVTARSVRLSKSTVTQNGVPISSWRRERRPIGRGSAYAFAPPSRRGVAAADRAGVLVVDHPALAQGSGDLPGHRVELLVARQRQDRDLDRGQAGGEAEHGGLLGPARGGRGPPPAGG